MTLRGVTIKPVTLFFVMAEVLDVASTTLGRYFFPQMWEAWIPANTIAGILSWDGLLVIKMLATLGVAVVLQASSIRTRLVWVVPLIAGLPVIWNGIVITAEFAKF